MAFLKRIVDLVRSLMPTVDQRNSERVSTPGRDSPSHTNGGENGASAFSSSGGPPFAGGGASGSW
jgi:hypothetical protein